MSTVSVHDICKHMTAEYFNSLSSSIIAGAAGINGKTKLLAVIGHPVEHSYSPQIHNEFCAKLNLDYVYVPLNVSPEHLGAAIAGLRAVNVCGFNVTVPHKQEIIKYLDHVSEQAEIIGAVNTVKNTDRKLFGFNTDGMGFMQSLRVNGVDVFGKNIVILGAGGAARGIAVTLGFEGAGSVTFVNRTLSKAVALADDLNNRVKKIYAYVDETDVEFAVQKCDILVNTTSVGLHTAGKQASPENQTISMPISVLRRLVENHSNKILVYDLIYNPPKTPLLEYAQSLGCPIINGWDMLVYQAAYAFEIWNETLKI